MTVVSARQMRTEQRRREILDAALDTLVDIGESRSFVDEVCRRASVSVGTLYHHFGSKDQLIATLHYTVLNDYQRGAGALLVIDPPAERGIKETVDHHLRWLMRNRRPATFLLQQPFAGYRSADVPPDLLEENAEFLAIVGSWLDRRMAAGELRPLPFDLVVALLIGPVHHWARSALFRGVPSAASVKLASAEIAEGASQALRPADPRSARPSGKPRRR
ncbi:MAG TPA: TetR/AcrR family transcriptional regulator [Acidimicrobiales bacterium]|nr:TetR/AcrR family transcriptional regulator [Acidimicrobiales bacterium]